MSVTRQVTSFAVIQEVNFHVMGKTKNGKKIVSVPAYEKKQGGKTIKVGAHKRSTPN